MIVNELYDRLTVQGEGPYTGRLCTFLRLWGCNLHCRWCDTPYTWDVRGRNGEAFPRSANSFSMTVDEIVTAVVASGAPLLIVSGGEPMTQASDLYDLVDALPIPVHVETNGTIGPPSWAHRVGHWSVSPKLPSAEAGNSIRSDALLGWATVHNAVFKVVVADRADIEAAVDLFDEYAVPAAARWVMPETDPHSPNPGEALRAIADVAVRYGLNISPRLHADIWGNQRGR